MKPKPIVTTYDTHTRGYTLDCRRHFVSESDDYNTQGHYSLVTDLTLTSKINHRNFNDTQAIGRLTYSASLAVFSHSTCYVHGTTTFVNSFTHSLCHQVTSHMIHPMSAPLTTLCAGCSLSLHGLLNLTPQNPIAKHFDLTSILSLSLSFCALISPHLDTLLTSSEKRRSSLHSPLKTWQNISDC